MELSMASVEPPNSSGIRRKKDDKQQQQRKRIETRTEIAPERCPLAWVPPCSQRQIQQEENADHARGTHPEPNQQRNSDQQFDYADGIAEEDGMRQYQPRQQGPIEAHSAAVDVVVKVVLEAAVGKCRPGDLVFAEQQKEHGRCDARGCNRPCQRDWLVSVYFV